MTDTTYELIVFGTAAGAGMVLCSILVYVAVVVPAVFWRYRRAQRERDEHRRRRTTGDEQG